MVEEENNEFLGVEVPTYESFKRNQEDADYSDENKLVTIGNVILAIGIVVGIICLGKICWVDEGTYIQRTVFNPIGFVITVGIIISSLITWAVLKVIANISKTLKEINAKIR